MQKKNTKQFICKTIGQFVPEWTQVDTKQVIVERMCGISNETYKVSHPNIAQSLIFREFGDSSDNIFLNRKAQQFVYMLLSKEGLGPKIMGMTKDIRIEQFIQSKVLKTQQMLQPNYTQRIAYTLRSFHSLKPAQQVPKDTLFYLTFFKEGSPILQKCLNKMQKPIFTEEEQKKLQKIRNWFTNQEIQFVKSLVKRIEKYGVVFSHNDLLPGNVLITKKENKVIFIDYQYGTFNYPIYDIANYFNQSRIFYEVQEEPYYKILEKPQNYDEMIDKFLTDYARAGGVSFEEYQNRIKNNYKLNEQEQKIYEHLKESWLIGQILSQLMWGWWSVIVSKNPAIKFDYISFAEYRYDQYSRLKKLIENKDK